MLTPVAFVWDGGGGDANWTTAANWENDIAPTGGEDLVFEAGAARLSSVNDFAAGTQFGNLTFNAGGYTISGNAIALAGDIDTTQAGGAVTAVGMNVDLLGGNDVTTGPSNIYFYGELSGTDGFGKHGTGTAVFFHSNTYTGLTVVDGGYLDLLAIGSVNGDLTVSGTGVVRTYSSSTGHFGSSVDVTVSEGGLLQIFSGISDTIDSLTLQGGTVSIFNGGSLTVSNGISTADAANDAPNLITGGGTLALAGDLTFTVADDPAVADDLRITDLIAGPGGVVKTGAGTLTLAAANTYTGTTTVAAGVLQVDGSIAGAVAPRRRDADRNGHPRRGGHLRNHALDGRSGNRRRDRHPDLLERDRADPPVRLDPPHRHQRGDGRHGLRPAQAHERVGLLQPERRDAGRQPRVPAGRQHQLPHRLPGVRLAGRRAIQRPQPVRQLHVRQRHVRDRVLQLGHRPHRHGGHRPDLRPGTGLGGDNNVEHRRQLGHQRRPDRPARTWSSPPARRGCSTYNDLLGQDGLQRSITFAGAGYDVDGNAVTCWTDGITAALRLRHGSPSGFDVAP